MVTNQNLIKLGLIDIKKRPNRLPWNKNKNRKAVLVSGNIRYCGFNCECPKLKYENFILIVDLFNGNRVELDLTKVPFKDVVYVIKKFLSNRCEGTNELSKM